MTDDELDGLPSERLAEMVREKRKAEASLRTRLRDAETRVEKAEGAALGFQRSAFEQAAADAGVASTAISDLASHVDLNTLLGDDGVLDGVKASQALSSLKTERPHLFARGVQSTGDVAFNGSGDVVATTEATWADVLAPPT